jgi:ribose 5-phosphate isomerase A
MTHLSQADPHESGKRRAARAALAYLQPNMILGIGTGTTVNELIELLVERGWGNALRGAVSSSEGSSLRLKAAGIPVLDLNDLTTLPLYIDGADEATRRRMLIKGGGAALTREKIVASCAERFVCIVDRSKLVDTLGRFPLPIEVIPMARNYVARCLTQLGGRPQWRTGVITDNGNHILDVHGLEISDPLALERSINQIAGVVTVGLFAQRPADVLIVGSEHDVETL